MPIVVPGDVGLNGLSADTPDRLGIDSGAVYANFTDEDNPGICVGASRGGAVYTIDREVREIEVDGTIAPTVGLRRRSRVVATIEVKAMELFPNNIVRMIAGADVDTSDPDYTVITGGPIETGDHITNLALIGTIHNNDLPVVCLIFNGLAESPFSLPFIPRDEVVIAAKWTGHAALATPYEEPWEMWLPSDLTGS